MASKIAEKLSRVAGKVGYLQKGGYNEGQKYYYASAEQVLRKVNAALCAEGIATAVETKDVRISTRTNAKGTTLIDAIVLLRVHFVDGETGESLFSDGQGQGSDAGDKAVMKATTAAYKYAMAGAFQISWGDDPEADGLEEAYTAATVTGEPTQSPAEDLPAKASSSPPKARRKAKAATPTLDTEEALLLAISAADTGAALNALIQPITDYRDKMSQSNPDSSTRVIDAYKKRVASRGSAEVKNA